MRLKNNKGSITIFVLVGLLFMTSFLVILYANNLNKSKIAKEQFNIISGIYSPNESDEQSYTDAYTALRKKNKQIMTKTVENSSTIELDKTYEEELVNYRIYGSSVTNTIEEFTVYPTKQGFLPSQGAYPTTDERFSNPTYEIIEIKKGQTLYFDYTGTNIGYVRVRCIDSDTNEVVCDLVDVEGNIAETDYYKATIYYTYTTEQTEGPDGYVTAKKDFKLGIMYLYDKPDDYNMKLYGTEIIGVGDKTDNLFNINADYERIIGGTLSTNETDLIFTSNSDTLHKSVYYSLGDYSNYSGKTITVSLSDVNVSLSNLEQIVTIYMIYTNTDDNWSDYTSISGKKLSSGSQYSFEIPLNENAYQLGIRMYMGEPQLLTNETVTISNFQVQLGTYATEYEPYGKYKIPVRITGKNLSKEVVNGYSRTDKFPKLTSTSSLVHKTIILKNIKAGTYTFSFEKPVYITRSLSTSSHDTNIAIAVSPRINNVTVVKITLTQDEDEYHLSFRDNVSSTTEWGDSWIQCEKGENATSYEQPKEKMKNIILENPLKDIEYIDFKQNKVVRADGTEEFVDLLEFSTFEDDTKIEVLTEVKPSRIELEYVGYTFE